MKKIKPKASKAIKKIQSYLDDGKVFEYTVKGNRIVKVKYFNIRTRFPGKTRRV